MCGIEPLSPENTETLHPRKQIRDEGSRKHHRQAYTEMIHPSTGTPAKRGGNFQ